MSMVVGGKEVQNALFFFLNLWAARKTHTGMLVEC